MKKVRTLLVVVAVTMAAACGKEVPPSVQAKASALVIKEIRVGPAAEGGSASSQPLTPRTPIAVEVRGSGGEPSQLAAVEVKLIELKTGAIAGTANGKLSGGGSMLALQIPGDSDLAPGRYLVEVELDGLLAGSRDVDVFGSRP